MISFKEKINASRALFKAHDGIVKSALGLFDDAYVLRDVAQDGTLAGMTFLVKDNICQEGQVASCASKILEHYHAPYNATVVDRLKSAGALIMGRANCDEFAMGTSTEYSAYQKTTNPWDITRVPGGSSGGSAAAVAAGFVDSALGSDTGGSVRTPAAFCGIVGIKPSYGRVSRYGLIAYSSSMDQIGTFGRDVTTTARALHAIAGYDERDGTSRTESVENYMSMLSGTIKKGLKIGIVDNAYGAEGIEPDVKTALSDALEVYKKMGAELLHLSIPSMDFGAAVYFIISRAEAASNLARFDGMHYGLREKGEDLSKMYVNTRNKGFSFEVRRRILVGNYVLSAGYADEYYKKAKAVQAGLRAEFLKAFKQVDVLFLPVAPMGAFRIGEFDNNPLQMDLIDYCAAMANLTGIPAISVPCGFTQEHLPVGFQLFGPDLSEGLLFQTAYAYEQATPWHTKLPQAFMTKV